MENNLEYNLKAKGFNGTKTVAKFNNLAVQANGVVVTFDAKYKDAEGNYADPSNADEKQISIRIGETNGGFFAAGSTIPVDDEALLAEFYAAIKDPIAKLIKGAGL